MFSCPHCFFPFTGEYKKTIANDTAEIIIGCKHCDSILRVQITTLKDPDQKKLKHKNLPSKTKVVS